LLNRIKKYKNFDKTRKQEKIKKDQIGIIIIIIIENTKAIIDKIKNHKNFDKRTKDKIKN
jgi:hypothetical protein